MQYQQPPTYNVPPAVPAAVISNRDRKPINNEVKLFENSKERRRVDLLIYFQ
mgnify:CR=1 FL=1